VSCAFQCFVHLADWAVNVETEYRYIPKIGSATWWIKNAEVRIN